MQHNRYQRIKDVLSRRQTDLTVCLEDVHKHHNLSAIVRSADAVGCHHVHAVWPENQKWLTNNTSGGRKSGQSAKLYTLDQNTAEATFVLRGPTHLNDLTFISESVCSE